VIKNALFDVYIFCKQVPMLNLLSAASQRSNTLIPDLPKVQAALALWAENYAVPALLKLLMVVLIWFVGGYVVKALVRLSERALHLRSTDPTVVRYSSNFLSVAMRIGLALGLLGYLGFETSSFAALIAAAGVAIGAAWAGLLSNFAAGIFLIALRPFKVGDQVAAAGISGEVKEIGLFGTKFDTGDGVRVTVGNSKIFADNISNFSHNAVRRADTTLQLAHAVDVEAAIIVFKQALQDIPCALAEPKPIVEIQESNALGTLLTLRVFAANTDFGTVTFELTRCVNRVRREQAWPIPETRSAVRHLPEG
jgi:small conductance mechanosensitive channel